ncbi:hypothetical protein Y032_0047g1493 [Ancylostoma ceylanicum]|uniref:Uncharacterized protein n=1 Tax=Ancylostoma ceylanicum TaxID=53326 RepID=A0A016UAX2_9BILA|nr:hypothetical protein Y032_0243g3488 [Ancylostoma ceylanicum]EYC12459.1 hypothetical protein Y032_0047g1493 [Ancylostoma ceylanicum]
MRGVLQLIYLRKLIPCCTFLPFYKSHYSYVDSIPYFLLENLETRMSLILRGTDREGTYDFILLEQMYHKKGESLRFKGLRVA